MFQFILQEEFFNLDYFSPILWGPVCRIHTVNPFPFNKGEGAAFITNALLLPMLQKADLGSVTGKWFTRNLAREWKPLFLVMWIQATEFCSRARELVLNISPAPSPSSLEFNLKGQKPGNSLINILRLADNPAKSTSPSCQNRKLLLYNKTDFCYFWLARILLLRSRAVSHWSKFLFLLRFFDVRKCFQTPHRYFKCWLCCQAGSESSSSSLPSLPPAYLPCSTVAGFLKWLQWICLTLFGVALCCTPQP